MKKNTQTRMTCTNTCCEYCGIMNFDWSLFPSRAMVCRKMLIHETTVSGVKSHFNACTRSHAGHVTKVGLHYPYLT